MSFYPSKPLSCHELYLVPNLRLGMPSATLRVAGRRAFMNGFPNRVWEPEKSRVGKAKAKPTFSF